MEDHEQTAITQSDSKSGHLLTHAQKRFYASSACEEARELLQALVDDPAYNTDPSRLMDNFTTFVERHLYYLSGHPQTNLNGYISNLKLMTSTKHARFGD